MRSWKSLFVLIAVVLITDVALGQGCSQCKLLAEQGSELDEASFGSNINYGILYLMAMPYIILLIMFRKRLVSLAKSLLKKA
jgi:hypothetical protein